MGLESVRDKKLLYHLTKLDNMESIISGGLCPRRKLLDKNYSFADVADSAIIAKRVELNLDIYTPFHFHPYSAFDVAVKNTYMDQRFAYICIRRAFAQFNNFKILVKHPLSLSDCVLYNYDEGINRIDWDTMETVGATDEYSRNVKMAECLTEKVIPAELFQCVYVSDRSSKQYIENIFRKYGITEPPPYVNVQEKWF